MAKCEKCLYRKNCQFLSKSKKSIVEDCGVFKSEEELKAEARKEFAERLKVKKATHYCKCGLSIDTTELINDDIDNLVKEMESKP